MTWTEQEIKDFIEKNPHVKIGNNVEIADTVILGDVGFGYKKEGDDYKIPFEINEHKSGVIIGDNVRLRDYVCVDRGSWRDTIVGEGTQVDHFTHIGHNIQIGKYCIIATGVMLGGSDTIGNRCKIWMNVSTKQGITIADNVTIGMGAVVTKDITEENTTWIGNPARQLEKKLRIDW